MPVTDGRQVERKWLRGKAVTEHYTKSTISATAFCRKCRKFTMHRVDLGRLGPCMPCIAETAGELKFEPAPVEAQAQGGLFDVAAPADDAKAATAVEAAGETKPGPDEMAAAAVVTAADRQAACTISREFVQACHEVGFDYRGYGVEGGDRVYDYSRRGAPEVVFKMRVSRWDHTAAMLEREARRTERWLR